MSVKMIEIDTIEPLVANMQKILTTPKTLSHDNRRDLENLVCLLREKLNSECIEFVDNWETTS